MTFFSFFIKLSNYQEGKNILVAKKLLINQFHLKELGYDFMGYKLEKDDIFTFHHLVVQAKDGGANSRENGAILCGKTSHPYIHLIQKYDKLLFKLITDEMILINQKKYLDVEILKKIHEYLCEFEKKYYDDENRFGQVIIKPEYKIRMFR